MKCGVQLVCPPSLRVYSSFDLRLVHDRKENNISQFGAAASLRRAAEGERERGRPTRPKKGSGRDHHQHQQQQPREKRHSKALSKHYTVLFCCAFLSRPFRDSRPVVFLGCGPYACFAELHPASPCFDSFAYQHRSACFRASPPQVNDVTNFSTTRRNPSCKQVKF